MGTVGQGLGDVDSPDALLPVEIGQGAPHLQHPMEAAGRQAHGVGRIPDQRQALRVGLGDLLQQRRGQPAFVVIPSRFRAA